MYRPSRRFYFKLCMRLGYSHPDHLLEQLTSSQISEWLAYDELDPIGDERHDIHMGILAVTIINIAKSLHGKEGTKMTGLKEFLEESLPWWGKLATDPEGQSIEEMKQILENLAMMSRSSK